MVNKTAHVIFELQDDSVENGIMQPVTEVLENSNRMLPKVLEQNDKITTFYAALKATGLLDSINAYRDDSWNLDLYERYYYTSHINQETATVPDEKRYGFTLFVGFRTRYCRGNTESCPVTSRGFTIRRVRYMCGLSGR